MSQENEREMQQLKNRFVDLANKSFQQNIFTFTGFLGLSEQDIFWQTEPSIRHMGYTFWGGSKDCDRKVLRFGNPQELGYDIPFPIICIHIKPVSAKFAEDLNHRDFLGALMNLGIERGTLGDIKVGEKEAYLFCLESIGEFICTNLTKVRHTNVSCTVTKEYQSLQQEEPEKKVLQVASGRIDAVIAKVYNKSRGDCIELFRAGKVYVNGRLCENNARNLKEKEVVNVRGFGKFCFLGERGQTKKGKQNVEVAVYR